MEQLRAVLDNEEQFNEVAKVGFQSTDTDNSGFIDQAELETAMKEISASLSIDSPSKEDVESVFIALDTDKSGKIDFNEFKVFVRKMLETIIAMQG
jgi:Ca2+-binding EF-hand superfamily protein